MLCILRRNVKFFIYNNLFTLIRDQNPGFFICFSQSFLLYLPSLKVSKIMAKLYLRRFSTLENYQNAVIEDGTFFVIVESGQLGVRKGELDILTPSNTLRDYQLPEGEVVITQNDTIAEAIAKLEKRVIDFSDNAETAVNTANDAMEAVRNLDFNGEVNPDHESRIVALENQIEVISEEEFEAKEGFDRNRIYYIYEND
jgi:hypothetical protein